MARRIAGCDLGKASVSFVIAEVDGRGRVVIQESEYQLHEGKPFEFFQSWYREKEITCCDLLAATGVYADELAGPVLVLPEDTCQEAALAMQPELEGALNLLS
ncbi:MAG: hypothetical protein ACE5D3_04345, partial [Candidatus Binatia bacterium]